MTELELTIARMIVQSSHHVFLVIHILTEQRSSTTNSVTATTTHMAMIRAGPLLTSPADGASIEFILSILFSSFSLNTAVVHDDLDVV